MTTSPQGRCGPVRLTLETEDRSAARGLLHDLGHQVATLAYLVETIRGTSSLPDDVQARLDLIAAETSRLIDMIDQGASGLAAQPPPTRQARVELRSLAGEVARLATLIHDTRITVLPGPEVRVAVSPATLWRVLSNVLDNAGRAAGPDGRVTVRISQPGPAVVEVTDDGPGFAEPEPGAGSLGLRIVTSLLDACGGQVEIDTSDGGGALVRIVLPARLTVGTATDRAGNPR